MNELPLEERLKDFQEKTKQIIHNICNQLFMIYGNTELIEIKKEGKKEILDDIMKEARKIKKIDIDLITESSSHPLKTYRNEKAAREAMNLYESELIQKSKEIINYALNINNDCKKILYTTTGKELDRILKHTKKIIEIANEQIKEPYKN